MRLGKWMRAGFVPLLAAGALAVGGVQSTHDGPAQVDHWTQAQAEQGPPGRWNVTTPDPPSALVLFETSAQGSALGFEIAALVKHLGHTAGEDNGQNGDEALEIFHETTCFVIFWLLEKRIDPGDPREMARTIDAYLLAADLPPLDYPKARRDLEKIYLVVKRAQSSGEIAREVAEAACDEV